MTQRVLSLAFNQWLYQIRSHRTAVDKAQDLFVRCYAQQTSAIFAAWHDHACKMCRLRHILQVDLGSTLNPLSL